jgi:hypothetical protein
MTDRVSSEQRSRMMAAVRATDTKPELHVRKKLFAEGFRYRVHVKELFGKPDVVLPRFSPSGVRTWVQNQRMATVSKLLCLTLGGQSTVNRLAELLPHNWKPLLASA